MCVFTGCPATASACACRLLALSLLEVVPAVQEPPNTRRTTVWWSWAPPRSARAPSFHSSYTTGSCPDIERLWRNYIEVNIYSFKSPHLSNIVIVVLVSLKSKSELRAKLCNEQNEKGVRIMFLSSMIRTT